MCCDIDDVCNDCIKKIEVSDSKSNSFCVGWVTVTVLDNDETLLYGTFSTVEEACDWATKLNGISTVRAVYAPVYNRD